MASTQENLSLTFVNNKTADQPAHPLRLTSTFVNHLLRVSYLNLRQAKFEYSS